MVGGAHGLAKNGTAASPANDLKILGK